MHVEEKYCNCTLGHETIMRFSLKIDDKRIIITKLIHSVRLYSFSNNYFRKIYIYPHLKKKVELDALWKFV